MVPPRVPGLKVLAGVPPAPSEATNDSILLQAASRVDLAAHEIAILSGGYGGGGGGSGGGGGLWMKNSSLTGRANEHVLLQAGAASLATGGG